MTSSGSWTDLAWEFDPYAPGFDADPHAMLRELRERFPIYYWKGGRAWLVSRYDDVAALLRDPRFSLDGAHWTYASEIPSDSLDEVYQDCLLGLPPVAHQRVRRLVAPSFTPQAIEKRRPAIRAAVCSLLDSIGDDPVFDLMSLFAIPLPMRIIGTILGVPNELQSVFRRYAHAVLGGVHPAMRGTISVSEREDVDRGRKLLAMLIEQRQGCSRDDLLSELILAEDDGDQLSTRELIALITSLVSAGSETTTHLIALGVLNLLRHPEQLEWLRAHPEDLPNAVEEVLRYDLFGRFGVPRYALEPVEIQGVEIAPGEMVLPMMNAALRDPRRFSDPDRFDVRRQLGPTLIFGQGPHYCLGAALARLEGAIAFEELWSRFPRLSLEREPRFAFHPVIRSAASIFLRTGR